MAVKNTRMGGADWSGGDILKAEDLNDTMDEASNVMASVGTTKSTLSAGTVVVGSLNFPAGSFESGDMLELTVMWWKDLKAENKTIYLGFVLKGDGGLPQVDNRIFQFNPTDGVQKSTVAKLYISESIGTAQMVYSALNSATSPSGLPLSVGSAGGTVSSAWITKQFSVEFIGEVEGATSGSANYRWYAQKLRGWV